MELALHHYPRWEALVKAGVAAALHTQVLSFMGNVLVEQSAAAADVMGAALLHGTGRSDMCI